MIKNFVVIKTQFEALHNWEDAWQIKEVDFLKHPHRHIFHVTMKWEVGGLNREIEFILQKREVEDFITMTWKRGTLTNMSCEMMCAELMEKFNACYVSVFEDNENGAERINDEI
jgi:hypothetical protein|tara:strand:- start:9509 stop:9850 length:342 start_codon:yes stop_codon:yes gene_type:complete